MIMTKDRRGIYCDLCGSACKDQFEYYSAKIDKVVVDSKIQKTGIVDIDRKFMDIDICPGCWDSILEKMKAVISQRERTTVKDQRNKSDEWSSKGV